MTDPLQTTQKGYWLVNGVQHSSLPEAFQDAGNRAQESPGTVVTVTPPTFEVVYTPPSTTPPPTDPIPTAPTVTGQTLTADKTEIHVGDTFTVAAVLDYSDGSTKPVGSYRLYGYDGSVVTTPAPSRTTFTAIAAGATTIRNDFDNTTGKLAVTVLAADAPPSDPPPADPPPADPVDPPPPPPPPPPTGDGAHSVKVTVDDGSKTWIAQAAVGEDWTVPATPTALKDADGNEHPGIFAMPYADGVDVGNMYGDSTTDYAGTLTVAYDGATVFGPQAVQFPRGCANKTIRYGMQAPWRMPDMDLFPQYAHLAAPRAFDASKYDTSYNGLGFSTYWGMGNTGPRPEIAYIPGWDVNLLAMLQSGAGTQAERDAAFAVVRAAADVMPWPIYFVDRATGHPFDVTQYPNVSLEPRSEGNFPGNPIAAYAPNSGKISGAKATYDSAHAPGYHILAAALTGTARDKWHLSVWANAAITQGNPSWHGGNAWAHMQERGSSWTTRTLFAAAHLSDMPEYFAARLDSHRKSGEKLVTNPLGMMATYVTRGFKDGAMGAATWEENMMRTVISVVVRKNPEWQVLHDRLKSWLTGIFGKPYWLLAGTETMAALDPAGNPISDWNTCIRESLQGWSSEDLDAVLAPDATQETIGAIIASNRKRALPAWIGQPGDLNMNYPQDIDGPPAILRGAVAGMCGAGAEWDKLQALPTIPDFGRGWEWNIVPRAAA